MAFHPEVLPSNLLGFGSAFGLQHRSVIFAQPNGQEIRTAKWERSRRTYEIEHPVKAIAALRTLQEFVVAREGAKHSFLLSDPMDHTTAANRRDAHAWDDVRIGTGDGRTTKFYLVTRYASGAVGGGCADCEITRPLRYTNAILAGLDGVEKSPGDFTVDHTDASITWAIPPQRGVGVFAGADFYVRVRFEVDLDQWLQLAHNAFESGSVAITMIEEKLGTVRETAQLAGSATSAHAGTQLTDTAANFMRDGVRAGHFVANVTDGSLALITSVDTENILTHAALAGGSENDWDIDEVWNILVFGKTTLDREVFGGGKLHTPTTGLTYLSFQDGLFNFFSPTQNMTIRLPDIYGAQNVPGYEEAIESGGPVFVIFNVALADWWKTNYTLTFQQLDANGNWTTLGLKVVRPNRTARIAISRTIDTGQPEWRMW